MSLKEKFVKVRSFPYLVSESGKVYSINTNRFLKPAKNKKGYLMVTLYQVFPIKYGKLVSRLVAKAFVANPRKLPEVHHIDYNKLNNHWSNLKWSTTRDNIQDSYDTKNRTHECQNHPSTVFNNHKVLNMRKLFENGMSVKQIAQKYDVHYDTAYRVIKKINYATL